MRNLVVRSVLVVAAAALLPLVGTSPAQAADEPAATELSLDAPASGYIGRDVPLTAVLVERADADSEAAPVAGATVTVQRWSVADRVWRRVAEPAPTDADGRLALQVRVRSGLNRFRAVFAGTESHAASTSPVTEVEARRIATTLRLDGPDRVVDERAARLTLRWLAADGRRVTGRVTLQWRRRGTTEWRRDSRPRVVDGAAAVSVRPRVDTVWRAVGPRGSWHLGDTSGRHAIDNVPPTAPVSLPAGAPRPSVPLPAQQRAVGGGLNATVTRIPDGVWRSMVGRSWHRGCPVGRTDLRLVRLNYWGFDGYRHRGELVVHRRVTGATTGVFRSLYANRYPIRAMYRVDRFGWSKRLQGANDYRSMAADNTSAFNCRNVVGRPGVRSPHAYGDSIDINPWENPYVSRQGTYPNTWWLSRSHPEVAWRSGGHPVVRAFTGQGFRWGGSFRDYHHFER